MKNHLIMLADLDPDNPMAGQMSLTDPRLYPALAMLGALVVAIVLGTIWAIRYSKRRKRHKRRHHQDERSKAGLTGERTPVESAAKVRTRRRWRKPRRPHRPLNPTLAQTGGLPPLRDENTPLPPMP